MKFVTTVVLFVINFYFVTNVIHNSDKIINRDNNLLIMTKKIYMLQIINH